MLTIKFEIENEAFKNFDEEVELILMSQEYLKVAKEGKAYKKMWEEMMKYANRYRFEYVGSNSGKTTEFAKERMNDIREKYFPKEVK